MLIPESSWGEAAWLVLLELAVTIGLSSVPGAAGTAAGTSALPNACAGVVHWLGCHPCCLLGHHYEIEGGGSTFTWFLAELSWLLWGGILCPGCGVVDGL